MGNSLTNLSVGEILGRGYIHRYDSLSAFTDDYTGTAYHEPWVSYTAENGKVDYNKAPNTGKTAYIYIDFDNSRCSIVNINDDFDIDMWAETTPDYKITFTFSDGRPDETYLHQGISTGEALPFMHWGINNNDSQFNNFTPESTFNEHGNLWKSTAPKSGCLWLSEVDSWSYNHLYYLTKVDDHFEIYKQQSE